MGVSVILPAYNEQRRIAPTIKAIMRYFSRERIPYEIIVVDDGSEDKTRETVKAIKGPIRIIKNSKNLGKGRSVQRGLLAAKHDLILFSDADLATPIEEFAKLRTWIAKGFDVVIASRNMAGSRLIVKQPWYRQLLGKAFPYVVRMLLLPGIKDTQCGFKLFSAAAARRIAPKQTITGFCFDVEMLYIAKRQGFSIKEVPVVWIDQKGSKVHPIKDSLRMLRDLVRIRMRAFCC